MQLVGVLVTYLKEQNHHFFLIISKKFLKHVLNIGLTLNNNIWKKSTKSILWGKKMAPKSAVSHSREKLKVLEFIFFLIYIYSSSLFVQIGSSKCCAETFWNKSISIYLTSGDFVFFWFFTVKFFIKAKDRKSRKFRTPFRRQKSSRKIFAR